MPLTDFTAKIKEYCTGSDLLSGVSCIVTGLSGGPDSVALICSLAEMRDDANGFPKIMAVHVNHGLRPSAGEDEALAEHLCGKLGVEFVSYHFDVREEASKMGRGLEETGRILRYKAFNEVADQKALSLGVDRSSIKIATAHHKGDLTETFLMNLFRGSGLDGLTAMSSDKALIRPLICVTKDEILSYLESLNEPYAVDETNEHNDFTRNKWRNEIIPSISEVSVKDPAEAVLDTYGLLRQDADYLTKVSEDSYRSCVITKGKYRFLKAQDVSGLDPAIRSRVIRLYWKDLFGNLTDFETKHLDIVTELIANESGTKYADLPFGRKAVVVNGLLGFYGDEGPCGLSCAMATYLGFPAGVMDGYVLIRAGELQSGPKTVKLSDSGVFIEVSVVENSDSIVYNNLSWIGACDELVIGACPSEGIFRKAGSSCPSDLKKIMSDMKVPRDARGHLIAVSSGDRILFIPGIGHSEGFISPKSREIWNKEKGHSDIMTLMKVTVSEKEQVWTSSRL